MRKAGAEKFLGNEEEMFRRFLERRG